MKLREASELYDTNVQCGKRRFKFWLKQEPATNDCFVKITEHSQGKTSSLYLGLVDLDAFIQSLNEALNASPDNTKSYTQFSSKKFENKEFSFHMGANSFGSYLEIQEVYVSGLQQGMYSSIYISNENGHIEKFTDCANQVKTHAQKLWKE